MIRAVSDRRRENRRNEKPTKKKNNHKQLGHHSASVIIAKRTVRLNARRRVPIVISSRCLLGEGNEPSSFLPRPPPSLHALAISLSRDRGSIYSSRSTSLARALTHARAHTNAYTVIQCVSVYGTCTHTNAHIIHIRARASTTLARTHARTHQHTYTRSPCQCIFILLFTFCVQK